MSITNRPILNTRNIVLLALGISAASWGLVLIAGFVLVRSFFVNGTNTPADNRTTPRSAVDTFTPSGFAQAPATSKLPFSLNDIVEVLGKPNEVHGRSVLYRSTMQVTETNEGVDIAFSKDNYGMLFAAGLFTSKLFTKEESDEIISSIDEIGREKNIGRFRVKVGTATQPWRWRQVSLAPIR